LSIVSGTTTLSNDTTDGVYQLWVDASTVAKGDVFKVRVYEKCLSGSTKDVFAQWSIMGVQSELFVTPTFILMHGWDMTIQKVSGTDRAFTASIRQVA
jgi:hypothetical protein